MKDHSCTLKLPKYNMNFSLDFGTSITFAVRKPGFVGMTPNAFNSPRINQG